MLTPTNYSVSLELIEEAVNSIVQDNGRYSLNEPTGNFFYDPWRLKSEFKGTVWEKLHGSLQLLNLGELRIICLASGTCYTSHADIDDRYHLNLSGNHCYMIDLDNEQLYPVLHDGIWYNMDAGRRHVAGNFGNRPRYQLVFRHLMQHQQLISPKQVLIKFDHGTDKGDARFKFDDNISPWLNRANKRGIIDNFSYDENVATFLLEEQYLSELINIIPKGLILE